MRVTVDHEAGMAYVYLVDVIAPGRAVTQAIAGEHDAVVDFDADGLLLGVEVGMERLPPELLAVAERIDGRRGSGDQLQGGAGQDGSVGASG